MMFTCSAHAPSSAAATKAASRKIIKKSGKKSFAVGLHCHVHVPEADAIAKASANVSKETLILALGGKMSAKQFRQFCADGGVEVDESAIKAGAPITTLRQVKVK